MSLEESFDGLLAALRPLVRALAVEAVTSVLAAQRSRDGADPARQLVTMAVFAQMRGVSLSTVRAAIRDGRLTATKIGRSVRVAADATLGTPVHAVNSARPAARAARILGLVGGAK